MISLLKALINPFLFENLSLTKPSKKDFEVVNEKNKNFFLVYSYLINNQNPLLKLSVKRQ